MQPQSVNQPTLGGCLDIGVLVLFGKVGSFAFLYKQPPTTANQHARPTPFSTIGFIQCGSAECSQGIATLTELFALPSSVLEHFTEHKSLNFVVFGGERIHPAFLYYWSCSSLLALIQFEALI
eukprot:EG_transcript_54293